MRLGAIVLCGGKSTRMGVAKAELPFGDETMLSRVVRRLAPLAQPIVVVTAAGQARQTLPVECRFAVDARPDRGPLEGLAAGLRAIGAAAGDWGLGAGAGDAGESPGSGTVSGPCHPAGPQVSPTDANLAQQTAAKPGAADAPDETAHVDAAYVTSCDVPMLVPAFVAALCDRLGECDIAVPYDGEFYHPLSAVYRVGVLPAIERLLATDQLRPAALFDAVPTVRVPVDDLRTADPHLHTLRNLNRPEDYLAALAEANLTAPPDLLAKLRRE